MRDPIPHMATTPCGGTRPAARFRASAASAPARTTADVVAIVAMPSHGTSSVTLEAAAATEVNIRDDWGRFRGSRLGRHIPISRAVGLERE
jgi:hypothetical protein